jgi:hypothetical protein
MSFFVHALMYSLRHAYIPAIYTVFSQLSLILNSWAKRVQSTWRVQFGTQPCGFTFPTFEVRSTESRNIGCWLEDRRTAVDKRFFSAPKSLDRA